MTAGNVNFSKPTSSNQQGDPLDKDDNRYKQAIKEQLANADQGIDVIEYMKNVTEGHDDVRKRVLMAFRQQYFSTWQAIMLAISSSFVTLFISAIVILTTTDYQYRFSEYTTRKVLMFTVGLFVGSIIVQHETRGAYTCDGNLKEVKDAGTEGTPCIDDSDCTKITKIDRQLCKHPSRHGAKATVRGFLFIGSLISIIVLAIASKDQPAIPLDDYIGFCLGLGPAVFLNVIFS